MANSLQSKKRARQAIQRTKRNMSLRSEMRTYVKKTHHAIATKNLDAAKTIFAQAVSKLDRLAAKGLIHKNKAARCKSRLNQQIKALALSLA